MTDLTDRAATNPTSVAAAARAARLQLARKLVAEALGTGLLVAIVIGSGIYAQRLSTDGGLQPITEGKPHPRAYGAFPRKLARYVRDGHVVELPFAIRSMTALAAEVFGIKDRGVVRPGAFADLVVFDLAAVKEPATYEQPHQLAVVWPARREGLGQIEHSQHLAIPGGEFPLAVEHQDAVLHIVERHPKLGRPFLHDALEAGGFLFLGSQQAVELDRVVTEDLDGAPHRGNLVVTRRCGDDVPAPAGNGAANTLLMLGLTSMSVDPLGPRDSPLG